MRIIFHIVRKEFLQIFRNRSMLPLIFVMPVVQLLILSNAADFETKHIKLRVTDQDGSPTARRLIGKFEASPYFELVNYSREAHDTEAAFINDEADLIIDIPPNFGREMARDRKAQVHVAVNAINGSKAGIVNNYALSIIQDFSIGEVQPQLRGIDIRFQNWFNPDLNFKNFMVPGILVMLVTMVGLFLSGMNIVREKEIGTIEQLNATPIRKSQFIVGKLLPFWIIGMFELAVGLMVGLVVFRIPIVGSPLLVFGFAAVYLLVVQGLGLLISTFTDTQQQAMFLAWFFMVIFLLMSGLFTPIESMPDWAQKITLFNPIAWFVEVIRMVMLKGSTLVDMQWHLLVMAGFAAVVNGLAVLNYRKTS